MPERLTVLFSSAGRRVELMNCFHRDAAALGLDLRVLATDMKPDWSAACQAADRAFAVPSCRSPAFIARMLEIVREETVDLIVPTIDTELLAYAEARDGFMADGCRVMVSAPDVIEIARDKLLTAKHLAEAESRCRRQRRRRRFWPSPAIGRARSCSSRGAARARSAFNGSTR